MDMEDTDGFVRLAMLRTTRDRDGSVIYVGKLGGAFVAVMPLHDHPGRWTLAVARPRPPRERERSDGTDAEKETSTATTKVQVESAFLSGGRRPSARVVI